jgi:hypothetical protein
MGVGAVRAQDDPPSQPESINGVIRRGPGAPPANGIDRLQDLFQVLQGCWQAPPRSGFSGQEVTLRLSFKRNGEILGQPRITFYKPGGRDDQRDAFTRSVREAFERCTPLPFSERFGAAIAGRPFTFRFIDARAL